MTQQQIIKKPHAYFDFDDTLIYGDSILYWRRFYYRKKPWLRFFQIVEWAALLIHTLRIIDTQTLKKYFFISSCYCSSNERNQLAEEFVKDELVPRFHANVLHMMWAHHKLGHKIVLISASSLFYLRFLSSYLPPATIMGTEWNFPNKGIFRMPVYRNGIGNLKEEQKVIQIRSRSDLPNEGALCFAYSDSNADRFLLKFVEFATVVDPDVMLQKIAVKNHWPEIRTSLSRSVTSIILEKLFGLFFALGASPAANKTVAQIKSSWSGENFDRNCFIWLKNRVERIRPEADNPEIHKLLFPGFPLWAQMEESPSQNLEWHNLGNFKKNLSPAVP